MYKENKIKGERKIKILKKGWVIKIKSKAKKYLMKVKQEREITQTMFTGQLGRTIWIWIRKKEFDWNATELNGVDSSWEKLTQ